MNGAELMGRTIKVSRVEGGMGGPTGQNQVSYTRTSHLHTSHLTPIPHIHTSHQHTLHPYASHQQ